MTDDRPGADDPIADGPGEGASDEHLQPLTAAALAALADRLDGVPEARWDEPSMCAGWRAREVVAHLTMPVRYTEAEFMAELAGHGFDFGSLSDAVAARDAALPVADLLAGLRSDVLAHWAPPGGGYRGALMHAVIHGLDVTAATPEPPAPGDDIVRAVLDLLTQEGGAESFGLSIAGRRLEASDLDWAYGAGELLGGTAGDLVLVLSNRQLPAGRLEGAAL